MLDHIVHSDDRKTVYLGGKRIELRADSHGSIGIDIHSVAVDNLSLPTRAAGRGCIISELTSRRFQVDALDNKDGLYEATRKGGWGHRFVMNTSRYAHQWVIANWDYADIPVTDPNRLRVMIDQSDLPVPSYYILPDAQYKQILADVRKAYLAKNGGTRPRTPESGHCTIPVELVAEWQDRWDLFTARLSPTKGE